MATRTVPATKTKICDICKVEQDYYTATQPFGLFRQWSSVTITRHAGGADKVVVPMEFETCDDCHASVAGFIDALIATRRQRDEIQCPVQLQEL